MISLPKAVSHPHLEAQSLGSAEYKHLHGGHLNICGEDKIKVQHPVMKPLSSICCAGNREEL